MQQQKTNSWVRKWANEKEEIIHHRGCADGTQGPRKMLDITRHQEKADENHNAPLWERLRQN